MHNLFSNAKMTLREFKLSYRNRLKYFAAKNPLKLKLKVGGVGMMSGEEA